MGKQLTARFEKGDKVMSRYGNFGTVEEVRIVYRIRWANGGRAQSTEGEDLLPATAEAVEKEIRGIRKSAGDRASVLRKYKDGL